MHFLSNVVSPSKPKNKSFTQLAEVLHGPFDPKLLVIVERFQIHRREQAPGENISNYIAELRRLTTHCDFVGCLDQAFILVCGIHHENTQKCLLLEVNLTLQKKIEIAGNIETAETQTSQFKGANKAPVIAVEHMKKGNGTQPETQPDKCRKCTRCGVGNHNPMIVIIEVLNVIRKCHKTGHLSSVYRSTTANPARETVNMFDGLNYRTLTFTVPFFKFQ